MSKKTEQNYYPPTILVSETTRKARCLRPSRDFMVQLDFDAVTFLSFTITLFQRKPNNVYTEVNTAVFSGTWGVILTNFPPP